MAARKNIFLIGRRGHERDEDQLTEMLAYLWQEEPVAMHAWLNNIKLPHVIAPVDVDTQFVLPSGKRPDICIRSSEGCTLVESKLGSDFGISQISDYVAYLAMQEGRRGLVLLTQRPEPVLESTHAHARALGVAVISCRWQDMAEHIGDAGEDSTGGDFIQLLIREGLVRPKSFHRADWTAWNTGYNVLLRVDVLLEELDAHVRRMLSDPKRTSVLQKRSIYRVWRSGALDLGFGLGAAGSDSAPHTEPIAFAFVGNRDVSEDDAMRAVGVNKASRGIWVDEPRMNATRGLVYDWPALARPASSALTGSTFAEQVEQAAAFMRETSAYFVSRGYLPAKVCV